MRRTLLLATAVSLATVLLAPTGAAGGVASVRAADSAGDRVAVAARLYWRSVDVNTNQQFRGLDAVDRQTAWVGGSDGGVWRTTNGGQTWQNVSPANSDGLLFRDVEARDADHASVLSIGTGRDSRIYTTTDGGQSWTRAFTNKTPEAFYDCMAFFRAGRNGIAVSDPVNGKFRILVTHDFGQSWKVRNDRGMPAAKDGEFAFAASGTCLVTAGAKQAWLGSGGGASRIFHTRDRGRTWRVTKAPIPASPAGGVFSLSFDGVDHGVAVGGDFLEPDDGRRASGRTRDGRTWTAGGDLSGYRSGLAWLANTRRQILVAVGPSGSDVTYDGGRTWTRFSKKNYDAVECADDGSCWASGPEGAVAKLAR